MKYWHFHKWAGKWTWGFAVDRTGFSLHVGPYSFWLNWTD